MSEQTHPLCVTLERPVSVPGKNHEPAQTTTFRAAERSVRDDVTRFFGLNIGPDKTSLEVANDNIRGIAYLGGVGGDE